MTTTDDPRIADLVRAADPIAGAPAPDAGDYTALRERIMAEGASSPEARASRPRTPTARRLASWVAPALAVAATVAVVAIAASALLWRAPTPVDTTAATPPPSATPSGSVRVPITDLVGAWEISGTGTALDGRSMAITEWELTVEIECGPVTTWWAAGSRAWVTSMWWAADGKCIDEHAYGDDIPAIEPLTRVVAYERSGDGWRLTDGADATVAELTPQKISASPWADWHPLRFDVDDPGAWTFPALAEGLTPATAQDLVGTWRTVGTDDPGATFTGTTWTNNGCHGGTAAFAVEPGGFFVTHGFAMNADLCTPADTLFRSGFAGFDGDILVIDALRLERVGD